MIEVRKLAGIVLAAGLAGGAYGTTVDLTTSGSSGTINGAVFEQSAVRPAGTGDINSFLRLQANSTEQGYNTSGRPAPFDDLTDPNFTRNVQVSNLVTRTIDATGTQYYEFLLDINESNAGSNALLSLDS